MIDVQYTQPGYLDFGEEALRKKEHRLYRRRRFLAMVRGHLRDHLSPRWIVAGLLCQSFLFSAATGWFLHRCGMRDAGAIGAWSVAAAWPVFLFLLHRRTSVECGKLKIDNEFERLIALDEREEATENAPLSDRTERNLRVFNESFSRECGRGGPAGIYLMILLSLSTAGAWLVWDLIRNAPKLIAEMLVDAHFMPAHPRLYRAIESGSWFRQVGAATAVYFFGLALIVLFVVADVGIIRALTVSRMELAAARSEKAISRTAQPPP